MLHFAPALDNMEATILLCISFLLACMVPKISEVLQDSHCTSLSQPTQSRHCPFSHDVFGSHLQVSGKHPATTTGSEVCHWLCRRHITTQHPLHASSWLHHKPPKCGSLRMTASFPDFLKSCSNIYSLETSAEFLRSMHFGELSHCRF